MRHLDETTLFNYAMGGLSDKQEEEAEAHLDLCETCTEVVKTHLRALATLTQLHDPIPSPPDGRERLLQGLPSTPSPQAWQPQLTRRVQVLLHAHPLLKLRSWDALRDPDTRHYDAVTLAVQLLDGVIESTGLGVDADSAHVARTLKPLLQQMDALAGVEPEAERHDQFALSLLGRLRNDDEARRPFKLAYTDFATLPAVRRKLELRLVEERFVSDDRVALELSTEAVNLFLRALDLDLESEQAALEAVVQSQLDRGRFDEAAASARDAKFRSVQFEQKIERILRETRRDVARVDWLEGVPKLLHEALRHLDGRLGVEKRIADSARDRLEQLVPGGHEAGRVALIAGLMDECFDRHVRLHGTLMGARSVFFAEQARQAFAPRPSGRLPNLFRDALEPLFAAPVPAALGALDGQGAGTGGALSALLGVRAPRVFSLKTLLSWSLRLRRDATRSSVPDGAGTWYESAPDVLRYSPETRQAAEPYLLAVPAQLSQLLGSASAAGEPSAVLEYLGLSTLQAFEGHAAGELRAQPTGTPLTCAGFYGDDFELQTVQLVSPADDARLEEPL